jgi:hypothetical protein
VWLKASKTLSGIEISGTLDVNISATLDGCLMVAYIGCVDG